MKNKIIAILTLTSILAFNGCKPYNEPEFIEIKSHETAFAIPLEGNLANQVQLDSEKFLEQKKIAQKRIEIPHRWKDTGRMWWEGEWIDTIRVLTVDRSPVTRQWNFDDKLRKGHDNAIWIESADSIGFSTGFSVSAYIEEVDAARFLYSYKATSLATVLDTELRARIQSVSSEFASKYKLDMLREKKGEMMESIKGDIVPFFKQKGITITTIGMFGGFSYENEAIQKSIDQTFIAQQEKVVSAAKLAAQKDINAKIEMEALALAEAAKTKSNGEAEGKKLVFAAEADGIRSVNKALSEANQNPLLINLKALDVERARVEKWNGSVPHLIFGNVDNQPFIFQIQEIGSSTNK